MNILIVHNSKIPVLKYGGTERVIWYLGKELIKLGHNVTFLVPENSSCDFTKVLILNENISILSQIPTNTDVIHFNYQPVGIGAITIPYLITVHGNRTTKTPFNKNSVFVSLNHAQRYGSESYVYNGLDWSDYGNPDLKSDRKYFHFLANAAWKIKNVKGAIATIKKTNSEYLKVLGGNRFNFKMGIRFTFNSRISFEGMVGGKEKNKFLNQSKGLIFPVIWDEPFGLAIIESLYFGCPVFGTPYGSLPEIITPEVGFLSTSSSRLAKELQNIDRFSRKECHEYASTKFNSKVMALAYLEKYNIVINGEYLNNVEPKLLKTVEKYLPWEN